MSRVVLVSGVAVVLVGCAADPDDPIVTTGDLTIEVRDATTMRGAFARAGSLVQFESRQDQANHAVLHLEVNDFRLDVVYDATTRVAELDGHDAIMFVDDREVMAALEQALEPLIALDPETPVQEAILLRAAIQLSEAPAGVTFAQQTISPSEPVIATRVLAAGTVIGTEARDGTVTIDSVVNASGDIVPLSDPSAAVEAEQDCYVGGEDGIWYLPSCNAQNWAEHDADAGGHCMLGESIWSGPNYGCMGRCGAGCGYASYTYDCLDHDRCCGVHGGCSDPWNGNCGDEYWEASDDWWNAWWENCA